MRLEPRVMTFAAYLAGRPDEVVSRDQLIESVWAGYPGADQSLNRAASMVRKALSEVGGDPEQLQTVPKRGYRLMGPVEFPSGAQRSRSFRRFAVLGAIGVLLLAVAVGLGAYYWPTGSPERSIAVLPFKTIGADEPSALAEGLHDDLLTRLSNIAELTVISRTSVEQYRDTSKNVRQIGRELGVKWILEGAVQESGDSIQVNAQLVDARSDSHAWAHQFRRTLTADKLFDMQGEITRKITDSLQAQLTPSEEQRVVRRPTEDLDAYELYVRGRSQLSTRTQEGMRKAMNYFQGAIEQDSRYALAWSGLADVAHLYSVYYPDSAPSSLPDPGEAARRAVELDPELAEAHASMGNLHFEQRNGPAALRELQRAVELKPSYAQAHHWLAMLLLQLGRLEAAQQHGSLAVELNPRHAPARITLALALMAQGELNAAEGQLEQFPRTAWGYKALLLYLDRRWDELETFTKQQLDKRSGRERYQLLFLRARAAAERGDTAAARKYFAELRRADSYMIKGWVHAAHGELDAALSAWEKLEDVTGIRALALRYFVSEELDGLRENPRYRALIYKINRQWGFNPDGSLPDEKS